MKKILLLSAISFLLIPMFSLNIFGQVQEEVLKPTVDLPVYFDISPPLRSMLHTPPAQLDNSWKGGAVKNYFDIKGDKDPQPVVPYHLDPGYQSAFGPLTTDTTLMNFSGLGNVNGGVPPDTDGDVSPNYYFQVVNTSFAIYSKTGTKLLGPVASSSIWSGMPNNVNSGDAIVLYDEQADRWLFSQFSLPNGNTKYMMIAVSQTSDPMGSWYRYQYSFTVLPDYPKFGVWVDGYYMSANCFDNATGQFVGAGTYAFDRNAMLSGSATATRISFNFSAGAEIYSTLPADCDGPFPPYGTPNYFTYITRTGTQHIGLYEFHADFVTPGNSTMSKKPNLNVTAFNYYNQGQGIPQLGSNRLLETLSDRIMNRAQFRLFNGYYSILLNHTIKTNSGAGGIRWYEIQKPSTSWILYQQGTYAPADGHSRWMGSIAQDTAGNIALGFSMSSSTMYPSIGYTGRLKNDPLHQMSIGERRIVNGTGSQTGIWDGRSRWGDYSSMRIDPSNPTTFWYTQEYYITTSSGDWVTRIASFSFQDVFSSNASAFPVKICNGDSAQLSSFAYGGSGTYTYSWTSNPPGFTSTLQNPKVGPDTATKYYVTINDGTTTRLDSASVFVQLRPYSFAGNDTTVNKYVDSIALHGVALNYRVFGWATTGDGTFEDGLALSTNYYPGTNDRTSGSVNLKLVAIPVQPCTGNVISTMHVTFDEFVSVSGPSKKGLALEIYPNPARSSVTLAVSGIETKQALMTITDMSGRVVYTEKPQLSGTEYRKTLDLTGFTKGVYVVQLKTDDQVTTQQLIVQ